MFGGFYTQEQRYTVVFSYLDIMFGYKVTDLTLRQHFCILTGYTKYTSVRYSLEAFFNTCVLNTKQRNALLCEIGRLNIFIKDGRLVKFGSKKTQLLVKSSKSPN